MKISFGVECFAQLQHFLLFILSDEEMPEERSESEEQSDDISNDDSDSESKIKNDAAEKEVENFC